MITPVYEPFVGLTYNGVHSSTLGLYRVSDGSRYNEDLLPSFSDKTSERTGADGMYFFGSSYQQRNWSIEFAFDHVTKEQITTIKRILGAGMQEPKVLIFDEDRDWSEHMGITSSTEELPIQKYFLAKVAQPPQLKTLCFDELDDNGEIIEIYKGELTIEFISYTPFGYGKTNFFKLDSSNSFSCPSSEGKYLNEGDLDQYPVIIIYKDEVDINKDVKIDIFIENTGGNIIDNSSIDGEEVVPATTTLANKILAIEGLTIPSKILGIVIDGEKGIINGLTSINESFSSINLDKDSDAWKGKIYNDGEKIIYNKDDKIYNKYITAGTFFKIVPYASEQYVIRITNYTNITGFKILFLLKEKKY